jgi:hypothetical protein
MMYFFAHLAAQLSALITTFFLRTQKRNIITKIEAIINN